MTTDAFLSRFYRASERRGSPRTVSLETRAHGGVTLEQAEHAADAYVWALCLVSAAGLTALEADVLRTYYLWLTPAHVSIVERRWGNTASVEVAVTPYRGTPLEAADLQSFCDWGKLAAFCGLMGRGARGRAVDAWSTGRAKVAEVLAVRGVLGAEVAGA